MAVRRVNPNRMELLKMKNQLRVARRGHKLLKDKRDELMRQFLILVKETRKLREEAEATVAEAGREMILATAIMSPAIISTALMAGGERQSIQMETKNTMSVEVPVFSLPETKDEAPQGLPYGMNSASGELDQAIVTLKGSLALLVELASHEKQTELLAREIEVTRRRVNSLEFRMIPDLEATIRLITIKMDENERGNLTRLMKVKDLILEQERQKRLRLQEAK